MAAVILAKLETLPASPGVYIFRAGDGSALYVGKAHSLRQRVRSYFQSSSSDERYFIAELGRTLADIETIVVANDTEASLLENQLIKELRPRHNVKLRDDKNFLSLRLDPHAAWPRLETVRRPEADGARYFGPYPSATAARQTLRLVNRHFQLRTCSDAEMQRRKRPCLQYQIKRCPAPCVYPVDRQTYGEQVRSVSLFLDGRHDVLIEQLSAKMQEAAAAMRYEEAAVYRNQLGAMKAVREDQRVTAVRDVDQDAIGYFRHADHAEITVLRLRAGKLVDVRSFAIRHLVLPDAELLAAFIDGYYTEGVYVPNEILLPIRTELAPRKGTKIIVPKRGVRAELLRLATDNAAHAFHEKARAHEDVQRRLEAIAAKLRLDRIPHRIECIDVSHTGGEDPVACIISLLDGEPNRRAYKSFVIQRASGGDDYGAMYEALLRRLRRGQAKERGWDLPDLLVVDGGRGQLRVALEARRNAGIEDLPVVALAKEKENALGETLVDRIYLPGQKNAIALTSLAPLAILALARDEAHRAANALRTKRFHRRRIGVRQRR